MVIIALLLVVVIAGAASYYVFVLSVPAPAGTNGHTTTQTVGATTSAANHFTQYTGTFVYSLPLGPSGEQVSSNGTVNEYRTILSASGTFSFFINPANQSGLGSGQGEITATTTGFCTGNVTVHYTFQIINSNTLLGGNVTVAFGDAAPGNVTYPLYCTNLDGSHYSGSGNFIFLSVYPNLVSSASVPATLTMNETGEYYLVKFGVG